MLKRDVTVFQAYIVIGEIAWRMPPGIRPFALFCSVYRDLMISWRRQSCFRPLLLVFLAYIAIVESRGERR